MPSGRVTNPVSPSRCNLRPEKVTPLNLAAPPPPVRTLCIIRLHVHSHTDSLLPSLTLVAMEEVPASGTHIPRSYSQGTCPSTCTSETNSCTKGTCPCLSLHLCYSSHANINTVLLPSFMLLMTLHYFPPSLPPSVTSSACHCPTLSLRNPPPARVTLTHPPSSSSSHGVFWSSGAQHLADRPR